LFDKRRALYTEKASLEKPIKYYEKELIQPILQGNMNAFTLFKPCPVAYERFIDLAENHNIRLSVQENVIVASNKSFSLRAKL
jgi:hypothetical protein